MLSLKLQQSLFFSRFLEAPHAVYGALMNIELKFFGAMNRLKDGHFIFVLQLTDEFGLIVGIILTCRHDIFINFGRELDVCRKITSSV